MIRYLSCQSRFGTVYKISHRERLPSTTIEFASPQATTYVLTTPILSQQYGKIYRCGYSSDSLI